MQFFFVLEFFILKFYKNKSSNWIAISFLLYDLPYNAQCAQILTSQTSPFVLNSSIPKDNYLGYISHEFHVALMQKKPSSGVAKRALVALAPNTTNIAWVIIFTDGVCAHMSNNYVLMACHVSNTTRNIYHQWHAMLAPRHQFHFALRIYNINN